MYSKHSINKLKGTKRDHTTRTCRLPSKNHRREGSKHSTKDASKLSSLTIFTVISRKYENRQSKSKIKCTEREEETAVSDEISTEEQKR